MQSRHSAAKRRGACRRATHVWCGIGPPRRAPAFIGWIMLAVLAAGCSANLAVRVWGPRQVPLPGVHVALARLRDRRCLEDWYAWDTTDDAGLARLRLLACGPYQVVVSGAGLRTHRQSLDTCRVQFLNVSVASMHSTHSSTSGCSPAAHRFIRAWLRRDHAQMRSMLVDLNRSVIDDESVKYLRPWSIDVQSAVAQNACRATVELWLESGCASRWNLEFRWRGEQWQVWKMAPLAARDLAD